MVSSAFSFDVYTIHVVCAAAYETFIPERFCVARAYTTSVEFKLDTIVVPKTFG